jgi:Bacterial Ig domain
MSLLLFLIASVTTISLHTYAQDPEEESEDGEEEAEEEEAEEEEAEEEEAEEEEAEEEVEGQISSFQEDCDPGQHYDSEDGCVPDVPTCDPGQHYDSEDGCVPDVPTCDPGQHYDSEDGCVPDVPTCDPGQHYDSEEVKCVPDMSQPEQVKLIVGVDVTNDNGGDKQPSDFNIKVTGTSNPSPAEFQGASQGSEVTLGTGDYEVTEITQDPNYQITSSGDCKGDVGDGDVNVSTTPITKSLKSLTCTISIDDQSPPPAAKDDRVVTRPNSGVKINVLNNDRATVDGTRLSVISVSESQNGGHIIINSDDTITYNNPNSNFRGEDRFNYEVSHLIPGSSVSKATATVTVSEQPIIKTCGDIEVSVIKRGPVLIKIDCDRPKENFDCYDINIDDSQVDSSNWKNKDHTVTYKPDPNLSAGTDSFRYELTCWYPVG